MKMQIIDGCGLFKIMKEFAIHDMKYEHCAIAVATKDENSNFLLTDYCMVEELGGTNKEFSIVLPAKVSYLLLEYCKKNTKIPVIIHTHTINGTWNEGVDFSQQDLKFMRKFAICAKEINEIAYCVFAVFDNKSEKYCFYNMDEDKYIFTRE